MKAKESKLSTRRSSLIMKYQRREPEWERTRLRVACSQFWRFSSSTPGWQAYSSEFVNYDKPGPAWSLSSASETCLGQGWRQLRRAANYVVNEWTDQQQQQQRQQRRMNDGTTQTVAQTDGRNMYNGRLKLRSEHSF